MLMSTKYEIRNLISSRLCDLRHCTTASDVDFQILFRWCNFTHKNDIKFHNKFWLSSLLATLSATPYETKNNSNVTLEMPKSRLKVCRLLLMCFVFALSRNGPRLDRTWTNDVGRCWHNSTSAAGDRPPRRSQQWTTCGEFLLSLFDIADLSCHRL